MELFTFAWTVFPPAVILLGLSFHVYHIVQIVSKKLVKENLFMFFIFLMTTDCLALCTSLLNSWLIEALNVDLKIRSTTGCQVYRWLSGMTLDIPPWILVLMTYEKRAFLWYPVPADSQFSRATVRSVIVGLTALFAIRNADVVAYVLVVRTAGSGGAITGNDNSTGGYNVTKVETQTLCALREDASIVFLKLFFPWLDFLLRVISPFGCLTLYSAFIVRKLHRERDCAKRLMEKVGIMAPFWFYAGLYEARLAMRRTVLLNVAMLVCGLPHSLYCIARSLNDTEPDEPYKPGWQLMSILLFFINYACLHPVFAVADHKMLVILRDSWQNPLIRKRGTNIASMVPHLSSSDALPKFKLTCFQVLLCRTQERKSFHDVKEMPENQHVPPQRQSLEHRMVPFGSKQPFPDNRRPNDTPNAPRRNLQSSVLVPI